MNKTKVLIFSLTLAAAPVLCAQTVPSVPDNTARILTPPPQTAPRINGPSVFGVRPGHPILYRVPVTGDKPITYSASGLPKGVSFDRATGQLSGVVANEGTYKIALRASNARGKHERLFRLVVGDTVALTPPMGWNSYNVWSDQITQERALAAARAMVSTGLVEHGWSYINMDDGWQGVRGGDLKALQPDARRFPDMKGTIDQIHGMGLKAGIYSSPWVITYANRLGGSAENPEGAAQRWPPGASHNKRQLPYAIGKYHFTQNDAKQFAVFGIDYLKYDWGPVEYPETKEMYDALHVLDRDI